MYTYMPLLTIWYCPAFDRSTTVDPRRSSVPSSLTILPLSRTRSNIGHKSLKSYLSCNRKQQSTIFNVYISTSSPCDNIVLHQTKLHALTSTSNELCASLRLALVSARGPQSSTSCKIGGYFGILMPTRSQPGFRSAFREGCRVNIVVTAPGNISLKTLVGTVTLAYLKWDGAQSGFWNSRTAD